MQKYPLTVIQNSMNVLIKKHKIPTSSQSTGVCKRLSEKTVPVLMWLKRPCHYKYKWQAGKLAKQHKLSIHTLWAEQIKQISQFMLYSMNRNNLPLWLLYSDSQSWCPSEYPNMDCIWLDAASVQLTIFCPAPLIIKSKDGRQKEAERATHVENLI